MLECCKEKATKVGVSPVLFRQSLETLDLPGNGKTLYEKIRRGQVIDSEEELLDVCWYYRYEMELFLEKVEFQDIQIHDVNFELNPGGFVYEATSLN